MANVRVGSASWSDKELVESGLFYPEDVKTLGEPPPLLRHAVRLMSMHYLGPPLPRAVYKRKGTAVIFR